MEELFDLRTCRAIHRSISIDVRLWLFFHHHLLQAVRQLMVLFAFFLSNNSLDSLFEKMPITGRTGLDEFYE